MSTKPDFNNYDKKVFDNIPLSPNKLCFFVCELCSEDVPTICLVNEKYICISCKEEVFAKAGRERVAG